MSSNPVPPSATPGHLGVSVCVALVVLACANAATVGRHGIWRLADYHFAVEEFWPEALRVGRTLHALPATSAPRWVCVGSSIVLYDVIPNAVASAAAADGAPLTVRKLATPSAVFSDAAIFTQLAHAAAPIDVAVVGVHPRDFLRSVDPQATLVANVFDHAALDVTVLAGGSPARRFERALEAVWPAFRSRRLQTRVFHSFIPAFQPPTAESAPPAASRTMQYDVAENAPTPNNPQLAELRHWAAWCHDHGIRPAIVYFPERTSDPDAPWNTAHGDVWIAALADACSATNAVFINAREAAPSEDFFDFNHLHEDGAVRFSAWLGARLRDELISPPTHPDPIPRGAPQPCRAGFRQDRPLCPQAHARHSPRGPSL